MGQQSVNTEGNIEDLNSTLNQSNNSKESYEQTSEAIAETAEAAVEYAMAQSNLQTKTESTAAAQEEFNRTIERTKGASLDFGTSVMTVATA